MTVAAVLKGSGVSYNHERRSAWLDVEIEALVSRRCGMTKDVLIRPLSPVSYMTARWRRSERHFFDQDPLRSEIQTGGFEVKSDRCLQAGDRFLLARDWAVNRPPSKMVCASERPKPQ
jgi:hypothetical protein